MISETIGAVDPLAGAPFLNDFLAGNTAARGLAAGAPLARSVAEIDWRAAAARRLPPAAPAAFAPWSAAEVAELWEFNTAVGNPGGACLAELLGEPGTLTVATGQQPNLLANPLYNLMKALTCVQAARQATAALGGAPVVPVFWVASDDHDFDELRACYVPHADGTLENWGDVVSRGGAQASAPAFEWGLQVSAARLREKLAAWGHDGGALAATGRALAEHCLAESQGFEDLFCRMLAACLGAENPVVFLPARLGALRVRGAEILRENLQAAATARAHAALAEQGERFRAAGYPVPLVREPDALNAFLLAGGKRLRLRLPVGTAEVRAEDPATGKTELRLPLSDLLHRLDRAPQQFSPNVVTRPLVQDFALPNIAYIGGPGELSYLAQLAPVWALHGVPQAVAAPRAFATLVTPEAHEALAALGAAPRALHWGMGAMQAALLAGSGELAPVWAQMVELESQISHRLAAARLLPAAERTAVQAALAKTERAVQRNLAALRRRLARQAAAAGSPVWRHHRRALALLAPLGLPQERVLGAFALMQPHHSPADLARQITEKIDWQNPAPQVLDIV